MSPPAKAEAAKVEALEVPKGASLVVKCGFYEGLEVCLDRDWLVIGRGRSAEALGTGITGSSSAEMRSPSIRCFVTEL